eukprot:Pgem_evm1s18314
MAAPISTLFTQTAETHFDNLISNTLVPEYKKEALFDNSIRCANNKRFRIRIQNNDKKAA